MVQIDGVGFEDGVAIHYSRVNILVESAGIERSVVKVADGEGYGVRCRWQKDAAPAHKVLGEGYLCVETRAEAKAPASAARGPTAASASGACSVGVGAIVVARHCSCSSVVRWKFS